jgi:hypothetical protein
LPIGSGSPFMKLDNGNNECYCGSNYPTFIKCYYYGTEDGYVTKSAYLNHLSLNLIIVDISNLIPTQATLSSNK